MSKRAKTIIYLSFSATTVKRLSSLDCINRIESLFEGVSPELLPTDIVFSESKNGRRPFSIDAVKTLDDWDPRSTRDIQLECRGAIRGGMAIRPHWGNPHKWAHTSLSDEFKPPPGGNSISASFDFAPLMKRGCLDDALRLFRNTIEFTHACHGRVLIAPASTAEYVAFDNPEYSKPYAVEWNGVLIEPGGLTTAYRNGAAVNCLPCFENWINVLGREYVELLGRENLLELDVHEKHEDSAGRIWLQITERPEQMYLPEVRQHVQKLMDSLNAPNVFCREPRTDDEQKQGVKDYRRPTFDLSGLKPIPLDPFSKKRGRAGINFGKSTIWFSEGYLEQIPRKHKHHFETIVWTLLGVVVPKKGRVDPVGVALAEDDELLQISAREPGRRTVQEQAELIAERFALMREQRPIKAVGACFYGQGVIPGESKESTAFKIHLESADGDAYVLYLPIEQEGRKREYGTLIIEAGEPLVYIDAPRQ